MTTELEPRKAAGAARLDRDSMTRWLTHGPVVDPSGDVLSWHDPERPGFAYPEMAGLWLQLPAARRSAAAPRVLARLVDTIRADAVGRDGAAYLFDEGAALGGLLAYARHAPREVPRDVLEALHRRIVRGIADGVAMRPPVASTHWSATFGPHLLKLARPLLGWARWRGDADADTDTAVATLCDALVGRFADEGRAITQPDDPRSYVHACCYALEGLLALAGTRHPHDTARAIVSAGAAFLARIQRSDGALPSWHDGTAPSGPAAGDATAQAVRIWSCVDPHAFARPRARALAHLTTLATPAGGLRYRAESGSINTWTTLFALQALDFTLHGADPTCLI